MSRRFHSNWFRGTNAERTGLATTDLTTPLWWYETDTGRPFYWNGVIWAGVSGTPGTCTVVTGNALGPPHTHDITTSSNPGAAASILASNAAGDLTLQDLTLNGAVLTFGAGAGNNSISIPDNIISTLRIVDAGGIEYQRFVTTNTQPYTVFNHLQSDVDFRVAANGFANALFVQGSSSYVGIGTASPDELTHIYSSTDDAKLILETTSGGNVNAVMIIKNPNGRNGGVQFWDAGVRQWQFGPVSDDFVAGYYDGSWHFEFQVEYGTGNVGIGTMSPAAKCHVDQASTTAEIPVLYLDQADVSEEMIEFNTTIGVGNAIEAVGGKTLTTTHFIKVTLPGALTRYIPVGTIA